MVGSVAREASWSNPVRKDHKRVHTVRCETGSGFYIWRVEWDNFRIIELVSGIQLNCQGFETSGDGTKYIRAGTRPDEPNNIIDLNLYWEERIIDGHNEYIFVRQDVGHTRFSGTFERFREYSGPCRPFNG